jgi:hypothetical protein
MISKFKTFRSEMADTEAADIFYKGSKYLIGRVVIGSGCMAFGDNFPVLYVREIEELADFIKQIQTSKRF